jgi:predicted glycoside hydrolase/deacetylase ChbG (UPF0249 family)
MEDNTMIKKLIVNADDFGMTDGVSLGILHAHTDGVVTSTTTMMNMPSVKFALDLSKDFPDLGIGIHLVLTAGRPLVDGATSYTDSDGNFIKKDAYPNNEPENINVSELYTEWKAQIELFIEMTGKKPTHIDSHHHVHLLPELQEVAIRLAREYDLPMRQRNQIIDHYEYVRCADKMYNELVNYDFLVREVSVNEDMIEFMCHPAYIDQTLYDMSSYSLVRMEELELLRSQKVKDFIKQNNISLISFADIKKV